MKRSAMGRDAHGIFRWVHWNLVRLPEQWRNARKVLCFASESSTSAIEGARACLHEYECHTMAAALRLFMSQETKNESMESSDWLAGIASSGTRNVQVAHVRRAHNSTSRQIPRPGRVGPNNRAVVSVNWRRLLAGHPDSERHRQRSLEAFARHAVTFARTHAQLVCRPLRRGGLSDTSCGIAASATYSAWSVGLANMRKSTRPITAVDSIGRCNTI